MGLGLPMFEVDGMGGPIHRNQETIAEFRFGRPRSPTDPRR